MANKPAISIGCLVLIIILCLSVPENGLYAYYNYYFGARALGLGNAFTAMADDLTAVVHNPAGLAFFQYPEFYLASRTDSLNVAILYSGYSDKWAANQKDIQFVSMSVPVTLWQVKWNFAASYYRVFPAGYTGTYSRESELVDVPPEKEAFSGSGGYDVLAFSTAFFLVDNFSIGLTFQQFLNAASREVRDSDDIALGPTVRDKSLSATRFILGLLARPIKGITIGAAYHFPVKGIYEYEITGPLKNDSAAGPAKSADTPVHIPGHLTVGLDFQPFDFLDIVYEYYAISWSKIDCAPYNFRLMEEFPFNPETIPGHRLGLQVNIPSGKAEFFLRAGLGWEKQPVVSDYIPPMHLKNYSLGLGAKFSRRLGFDLAYMQQRGHWPETDSGYSIFLPGSVYKNTLFILGLTYTFTPKQSRSHYSPH